FRQAGTQGFRRNIGGSVLLTVAETSAFFLTVLLSGPLFAALLLRLATVDFNGWFFAELSVAALVISAAVIITSVC
ncbi:hypothetical protein Q6281_27060, partial [Klebsiella pneumoniae]|nr:hypothetical protein [Klebsiella pneumoniae]